MNATIFTHVELVATVKKAAAEAWKTIPQLTGGKVDVATTDSFMYVECESDAVSEALARYVNRAVKQARTGGAK